MKNDMLIFLMLPPKTRKTVQNDVLKLRTQSSFYKADIWLLHGIFLQTNTLLSYFESDFFWNFGWRRAENRAAIVSLSFCGSCLRKDWAEEWRWSWEFISRVFIFLQEMSCHVSDFDGKILKPYGLPWRKSHFIFWLSHSVFNLTRTHFSVWTSSGADETTEEFVVLILNQLVIRNSHCWSEISAESGGY